MQVTKLPDAKSCGLLRMYLLVNSAWGFAFTAVAANTADGRVLSNNSLRNL